MGEEKTPAILGDASAACNISAESRFDKLGEMLLILVV